MKRLKLLGTREKISARLAMPVAPVILVVLLAMVVLTATRGGGSNAEGAHDAHRIVRLATTTSTDNSGLLEMLLPQFERDTGYSIQVLSVGTGKALRLGENGDVDALLVHAPHSEQRFIRLGHGVARRAVMRNDFVVVGPPADPAGLRQANSVTDAFQRLRAHAALFVSRGDDSGTHKKELNLWRLAGVRAWGKWRLEVGQGMGKSLQIADELRAYLLIDRGTWLALQANTSLRVLYQGGEAMHNLYSVMAVNPQRHHTNFAGAEALSEWLTSPVGQRVIGAYTINGAQLFTPTAAR